MMTTLKLTMMLGPRETIEAAEAAMPEMAHCLFAADVIEGWDADEVERVLLAAGAVFRQAIAAGEHERPPPPPRRLPAEVEEAMRGHDAAAPPVVAAGHYRGGVAVDAAGIPGWARDTWGDPVPAGAPIGTLRLEVARAIEPEAWGKMDASLKKADEVLAVIERWRAA